MDALIGYMSHLEAWHWVALGLILIGIEVAAGTFDLLFIGIAAFATALFEVVAPGALGNWQWQICFFAVSSFVLVVLSRTIFADMRSTDNKKPGLSQRMVNMIGSRGVVTQTLTTGSGRVKIGDTEWSAESLDGSDLAAGTKIVVEETEMTVVKVKPV